MKKIGIMANVDRDFNFDTTKEILRLAKTFQFSVILPKYLDCLQTAENSNYVSIHEDVFKEAALVIVLGGDGTMLRAAQRAAITSTPILGINLGYLGYLTDVEKTQTAVALEKISKGNFLIEKRMMLSMDRLENGMVKESYLALNDVFVSKSNPTKMVELNVSIEKEYFETYRADGVIIATPTGSTAYNLSAGGPILKPDAEMIAITPVCAHDLHSRSVVLASTDPIEIKATSRNEAPIEVACDGDMLGKLLENEVLRIYKSIHYTKILRTAYMPFYERLRLKIGQQA